MASPMLSPALLAYLQQARAAADAQGGAAPAAPVPPPEAMQAPPRFSESVDVHAQAPQAQAPMPPPFMQPQGGESAPPPPQAMTPPPGAAGKASGGGSDKWKQVLLAAGMPLAAFLGSKLSGGSLSTGEAMAHLGIGFGNEKYRQVSQKRRQKIEQENQMLDRAHKVVMEDLAKVSPEALAKFPRINELSQKYRDSLADDGQISPKEAQEINALYSLLQPDLAAAKEFDQGRGLETQERQKAGIRRNLEIEDIQSFLPNRREMPGPTEDGAPLQSTQLTPPPQLRSQAEDLYKMRGMAEFESNMPVEYDGRMIPRKEALALEQLASKERIEEAKAAEREAREDAREQRWEQTQKNIASRFDATDARQREQMANSLANALRDDYRQEIKPFGGYTIHSKKLEALFPRLQKDATGTSDLAFVTTFLKLLDDNAVREHETKMAANLGSVSQKAQAWLGNWKSGTILSPSLRAEYMKTAREISKVLDTEKSEIDSEYTTRAQQNGVAPNMVVRGSGKSHTSLAPPPGGEMLTTPDGKRWLKIDGKYIEQK